MAPQPEPRAVQGMPCSRAYRTKSQTIRKYDEYPIFAMMASSRFEAVRHVLADLLAVPFRDAPFADFAEVIVRRLTFRRRENGKVPGLEVELDIDLVRDFLAARDGVFEAREEAVHVAGAADVIRVRHPAFGVLLPLRVPLLAGVDAEQNVVGLRVVAAEVVGVGRGHEGHAAFLGEVQRGRGAGVLEVDSVVLDFEVEVVAERFRVPMNEVFGLIVLIAKNELIHFAGEAAGEADQALAVFAEEVLVDPRVRNRTLRERLSTKV